MPEKKPVTSHAFPSVEKADPAGLLAAYGDLSVDRLMNAYMNGIFPWYEYPDPILWWSPDPRFVLFPNELHISESTKKFMRRQSYRVTFDSCFDTVIYECAQPRKEGAGTWITGEMFYAYCDLHRSGFAHSVEIWYGDLLAGGLYGISIGKAFFAESMFHRADNGSKLAVIELIRRLKEWDFHFMDSQLHTPHVEKWGARQISRQEYLEILNKALQYDTLAGNWGSGAEARKIGPLPEDHLKQLPPIVYLSD